MEERNIRKAEARKLTGLSDTTIWRLERKKQFPARRQLSVGTVGWRLSEILTWLETRPVVGKEVSHVH